MITISIPNPKGGVGKSNTSRNLARGFQKKGFRVALAETDKQGTLSSWRANNPDSDQPVVHVMCQSRELLQAREKLQDNYDILIIDGAANDPSVTHNLLKVADLALIVFQPSDDDMAAMGELIQLGLIAQQMNKGLPHIRLLLNRCNERSRLAKGVRADLKEESPFPLLSSSIPDSEHFKIAAKTGGTIYEAGSKAAAGKMAIERVVNEVVQLIESDEQVVHAQH